MQCGAWPLCKRRSRAQIKECEVDVCCITENDDTPTRRPAEDGDDIVCVNSMPRRVESVVDLRGPQPVPFFEAELRREAKKRVWRYNPLDEISQVRIVVPSGYI